MAFIDDYNHEDVHLVYTPENIPTSETAEEFYEITIGCECESKCIESKCPCLHSKKNYKSHSCKDNLDSLQNYELLKTDTPIYECNQNCKCSKFCGNRLVQYGPRHNLAIAKCDEVKKKKESTAEVLSKGFGLITKKSIKHGQFVCEYAGEIISQAEANKRFRLQEDKKLMNYIVCVNENFGDKTIKTFIDPSRFGNIGRYINHSCEPNCEVIPVRVNSIIPKLCIFAKLSIPANEELSFDYGDGNLGFTETKDNVKNKKPCLCNVINCRKFLPFCK